MKRCILLAMSVLFFTCCSKQQMENEVSGNLAKENSEIVIANSNPVNEYLEQARWGDGSAFIKLAECYHKGIGVKPDFMGTLTMLKWQNKMDMLAALSDRVPLANQMLGDYYSGIENDCPVDVHLAAKYYIKADEQGCLGKQAAQWLLEYYQNEGITIDSTETKRLHILSGTMQR